MTCIARDGRDGPFSDWLRSHQDLDSRRHSLYAADIDMMFYKFRPIIDKCGDRSVKLTMNVEIKTHGRMPNKEQLELLFFAHQTRCKRTMFSTYLQTQVKVWFFGQFILRIDGGDRPDQCAGLAWITFDDFGNTQETVLSEEKLVKVLRFDLAPDNLQPIDLRLRRHHKTTKLFYVDTAGLFPVERMVVKRS